MMNKILVAILFVSLTTLNISCDSKSKDKHRTKSSEYLPVTKVMTEIPFGQTMILKTV